MSFKPSEFNRTNRVLRGYEDATGFQRARKPQPLDDAYTNAFASAEAALATVVYADLRQLGYDLGWSSKRDRVLESVPGLRQLFEALEGRLPASLYPGF